jgi:hypothetical protein
MKAKKKDYGMMKNLIISKDTPIELWSLFHGQLSLELR